MTSKRNYLRDAFAFQLRGMTATASYFIMPVLDDGHINRAIDEKLAQAAAAQAGSSTEEPAPELGAATAHLS